MTRAVLFDLDGVLIDSQEAWYQAMAAATEVFGAPPLSRERFTAAFGQSIADDVEQFYPGRTLEEVEGWLVANFGDHVDHVRFMPGGPEVFAALAAHGLRTAVVTNTPHALARQLLARGGLRPETVVGTDDVAQPKPAPDCVLAALAWLEVPAGEALLLGDSRFDSAAAGAAGVRFVGYGYPAQETITSLLELLPLCGIRL